MTPCEKRNWKEGQVFKCIDDGNGTLDTGDILVLNDDDESRTPGFQHIESSRVGYCGYYKLDQMKRIYPPEEESKEVEVECEGKKTTISRESAKALNLI